MLFFRFVEDDNLENIYLVYGYCWICYDKNLRNFGHFLRLIWNMAIDTILQ
jgi:hypothetical protein